jgi:hypothetical protein
VFYYFLPQPTIHGGIKVGFQFASMLRKIGAEVAMVTPNGSAPSWFPSNLTVLRRERVLPALTKTDKVLFSHPRDYQDLEKTSAKLILHCQGTDESILPIIYDKRVELLACWEQAENFFQEHSRQGENVGISISEVFFYNGQLKKPGSYSIMPRRGTLHNEKKLVGFDKRVIDNCTEKETGGILKSVSGFIAIAENEGFGLPALEAMAAGCLVVSPRTIGGGEYLTHGINCLISEVEDLSGTMAELLSSESSHEELRFAAMKTASAYHPRTQLSHLRRKIESGGLKWLH